MLIEQQSSGLFALTGELDHQGVVDLWPLSSLPLAKEQGSLELDLAQVSRMDTSGVAWLISVVGFLRDRGIELILLNPPKALEKLTKVSDVQGLLPFGNLPVE